MNLRPEYSWDYITNQHVHCFITPAHLWILLFGQMLWQPWRLKKIILIQCNIKSGQQRTNCRQSAVQHRHCSLCGRWGLQSFKQPSCHFLLHHQPQPTFLFLLIWAMLHGEVSGFSCKVCACLVFIKLGEIGWTIHFKQPWASKGGRQSE